MFTHYLSLVLSLYPVLLALLVVSALFVWTGLGYLGLRLWVATLGNTGTFRHCNNISLRYLALAFGPVSLIVSVCPVIIIFLYILVVEMFWQDVILAALRRFHTHIKNLR